MRPNHHTRHDQVKEMLLDLVALGLNVGHSRKILVQIEKLKKSGTASLSYHEANALWNSRHWQNGGLEWFGFHCDKPGRHDWHHTKRPALPQPPPNRSSKMRWPPLSHNQTLKTLCLNRSSLREDGASIMDTVCSSVSHAPPQLMHTVCSMSQLLEAKRVELVTTFPAHATISQLTFSSSQKRKQSLCFRRHYKRPGKFWETVTSRKSFTRYRIGCMFESQVYRPGVARRRLRSCCTAW